MISIIGLLAAVVLSALNSARKTAKLSKVYQQMVSINQAAYACRSGGGLLQRPAYDGVGGTPVCTGGSDLLPNITSTGFVYCGFTTGIPNCGGWNQGADGLTYAISAYTLTGSEYGSQKFIICGYGVNVTGWFDGTFNLGNDIKCQKNW